MVDTGDPVADANYVELLNRRAARESVELEAHRPTVRVDEPTPVDNPDPGAPCVQCGGRRVPGTRLCEDCASGGPREMDEDEVADVVSITSPLGASTSALTESQLRELYEKSLPKVAVHYAHEDVDSIVPVLDRLKNEYHFTHAPSQLVSPGTVLVVNQASAQRLSVIEFEKMFELTPQDQHPEYVEDGDLPSKPASG